MAQAYTKSKDTLTAGDQARFVCAFLHVQDANNSIDWAAAALDFNPDLKPASFKTMTMKAMKRFTGDNNNSSSSNTGGGKKTNGTPTPAPAVGASGGNKKRKVMVAAAADGDDGDGDAVERPRAKTAKRLRKANTGIKKEESGDASVAGSTAGVEDNEAGDVPVKADPDDGEEDENMFEN